jgi:hypothetical protein
MGEMHAAVNDLRATCPHPARVVDYDVHALVGIGLIDPEPQDVVTVSTQIGPMRTRSTTRIQLPRRHCTTS